MMALALADPWVLTLANGATRLVDIVIPAAGVTLILAGLLMWGRKRRQQSQQQQVTPREQLHRMNEERAVRGDLEQIMVEIEQLAKRMGAQLDAKSMRLERLLRDADARIAELERRQGGGERSDRRAPRPAEPEPEPEPSDEPPIPAEASAPTAGRPAHAPPADERELATAVYRLADAGLTPLEIARQLNEHQGKIELVLALRQS